MEDRRSALGRADRRGRFVGRHRARWSCILLNGAVFLALVAGLCLAFSGSAAIRCADVATLGLGQFYILVRHYVKLLFYASETSFFQRAFAHASLYGGAGGRLAGIPGGRKLILHADSDRPVSRPFPR